MLSIIVAVGRSGRAPVISAIVLSKAPPRRAAASVPSISGPAAAAGATISRDCRTGALKKKLGLEITSKKVEGLGRVYRIER